MKALYFLLFSLMITNSFSKEYRIGDSLYIWAKSGLKLHTSANQSSVTVLNIPYGELVIVSEIEENGHHSFIEIEENDKIPCVKYSSGFIKVEYGEQEGFLFTGLLSSLPTVIFKKDNQGHISNENIQGYLSRNFRQLQIVKNEKNIDSEYQHQVITYSNGMLIDEESRMSSWSYSYVFTDYDLHEIYLLINTIIGFEKKYKEEIKERKINQYDYYPITFSDLEIKLSTGQFETTTIKKEHNFIIVHIEGGN
jgi:hypothetical protein